MSSFRSAAATGAALAIGALILAGCGSTSLTSTYHEKPFTVDGDPADWVGLPVYVDRSGVNVAVSNDTDYLYLMISTTDRGLQSQIRHGGITVWFDPTGGSAHTFGIRYPMGMPGMPPPDMEEDTEEMMPPPGSANRPPQAMRGKGLGTDMEVLGPEDQDRMIVSLVQEKQIQAKISDASGGLTYELRVPLQHDTQHPHGIGVIAGKNLGLALVTEAMEARDGKSGRGPRGGREGGRGGMRPPGGDDQQGDDGMMMGGEGPGGGRGYGGMRGDRGMGSGSSSIDITLKVVLGK